MTEEERLFPSWKVCYWDFGTDGAGPISCDCLAVAGRGDAKSDGVEGACRKSRWSCGDWNEREWSVVGLVMISDAGPNSEHQPVIVSDALVSRVCCGVVVVGP